jgi:hypothetical protein
MRETSRPAPAYPAKCRHPGRSVERRNLLSSLLLRRQNRVSRPRPRVCLASGKGRQRHAAVPCRPGPAAAGRERRRAETGRDRSDHDFLRRQRGDGKRPARAGRPWAENGTLRVVAGCCPHLLAEADLYRYSDELQDRRAETPVDANNHALAALRYLISKLDEHHMARTRRSSAPAGTCEDSSPGHPPADGAASADTRSEAEKERAWRWWELANNPDVWRRWER